MPFYKWRAVAVQSRKPRDATVKYCRCRLLIILEPTKSSGTEDKSFAEVKSQETTSQASRKGHWLYK